MLGCLLPPVGSPLSEGVWQGGRQVSPLTWCWVRDQSSGHTLPSQLSGGTGLPLVLQDEQVCTGLTARAVAGQGPEGLAQGDGSM